MTHEEETKAFLEKLEANAKLPEGRICDGPEDIAEAEAINQHMRKVVMDYRRKAAISREKARGFVFHNNRVRS